MKQLGAWDSPEAMAGQLGSRAGHFLRRIVGEAGHDSPGQTGGPLRAPEDDPGGLCLRKSTLAHPSGDGRQGDFEMALERPMALR